jgi:hypothetical protein
VDEEDADGGNEGAKNEIGETAHFGVVQGIQK